MGLCVDVKVPSRIEHSVSPETLRQLRNEAEGVIDHLEAKTKKMLNDTLDKIEKGTGKAYDRLRRDASIALYLASSKITEERQAIFSFLNQLTDKFNLIMNDRINQIDGIVQDTMTRVEDDAYRTLIGLDEGIDSKMNRLAYLFSTLQNDFFDQVDFDRQLANIKTIPRTFDPLNIKSTTIVTYYTPYLIEGTSDTIEVEGTGLYDGKKVPHLRISNQVIEGKGTTDKMRFKIPKELIAEQVDKNEENINVEIVIYENGWFGFGYNEKTYPIEIAVLPKAFAQAIVVVDVEETITEFKPYAKWLKLTDENMTQLKIDNKTKIYKSQEIETIEEELVGDWKFDPNAFECKEYGFEKIEQEKESFFLDNDKERQAKFKAEFSEDTICVEDNDYEFMLHYPVSTDNNDNMRILLTTLLRREKVITVKNQYLIPVQLEWGKGKKMVELPENTLSIKKVILKPFNGAIREYYQGLYTDNLVSIGFDIINKKVVIVPQKPIKVIRPIG